MSKAPRAIRLDPQDGPSDDAVFGGRGDVAVVPEVEPIEPEAAPIPQPRRRRVSWGSLFVAALSGLLALSVTVWAEQTIRWLLALNPAVGIAALVCAGVAALALLVMLLRVLRDILRERRVEALRASAPWRHWPRVISPRRAASPAISTSSMPAGPRRRRAGRS